MNQPNKREVLRPESAARVWEQERQITEAITQTKRRLDDFVTALQLEARARPTEIGLLDLLREVNSHDAQINRSGAYSAQREAWRDFAKVLNKLVQRYEDMKTGWQPVFVQDKNAVLPRRDVIAIMEKRGWKGSVQAFCGQASVDEEIAACKGPGGKNWYVEKVYELGVKRGKLPEAPKVVTVQGPVTSAFDWARGISKNL
jgi:hypothetical protein